jgi:hypothetical protein
MTLDDLICCPEKWATVTLSPTEGNFFESFCHAHDDGSIFQNSRACALVIALK